MAYNGEDQYITLYDEEAGQSTPANWATVPGSPDYFVVPVTAYSVRPAVERRISRPRMGGRGQRVAKTVRSSIGGAVSGELYAVTLTGKSTTLAEYIIDWLFGGLGDLYQPSKGVQYQQGDSGNVAHKGLMATSATLQSAAGSPVTWSANVVGKQEDNLASMAQAVPADFDGYPAFEHCDTTLVVDGTTLYPESWSLTRNTNIQQNGRNSCTFHSQTAGGEVITLTATFDKDDTAYTAFMRTRGEEEVPITLTMKGLTQAGGSTFRLCTFTLPKCSYADVPFDEPLGQLATQSPNWDVLRDGSAAEFTKAWSTPS